MSTTYKLLLNTLLSRLLPNAEEILGGRECGFRRNSSAVDRILCICQILEENREQSEAVLQPFQNSRKQITLQERDYLEDKFCV